MAPSKRLTLKIVRRPASHEAPAPEVVPPKDAYTDNDIIFLHRRSIELTEPITENTPDILKISLGILKKHSTLLRDLFEQKVENHDAKNLDNENLKKVIYDSRQDPVKSFLTNPSFFANELIAFVIANKVPGYEFIEDLTVWCVFTGVRAWLEWAKKPGFLWNEDNIYVIVTSISVAEWLGATDEFKEKLMEKKTLLERGASVRGITH